MATTPDLPALSAGDRVVAVIVTKDRVSLLRDSLACVAAQSHPVWRIVVVDNGADPKVEKLLDELAGERGVYLPSRTNLGGAGGFAYGFLHALALGAEAIWCADDDGTPADERTLEALLDQAERRGLHEVSPVVCSREHPEKLAFPLRQGLTWRRERAELTGEFLPGIASLFNGAVFSARALEVLGVPDYRLFIRGDEVEYHRRLQRSGLRFGTALNATYLHPEGASEFRPILGGRMHTQYPSDENKRYFTYRNRGYLMNQPGMRRLLPQEYLRFAWFFLVQRRDPKGFVEWLSLHRRGRREHFERP